MKVDRCLCRLVLLCAALAARMAQGLDAIEALAYAQQYTAGTLQHACRFGMGRLIPNKLYKKNNHD